VKRFWGAGCWVLGSVRGAGFVVLTTARTFETDTVHTLGNVLTVGMAWLKIRDM